MESIKHLTDEEQAGVIADKFARVSQEYDPLQSEDINVPEFEDSSIPEYRFSFVDDLTVLEKIFY